MAKIVKDVSSRDTHQCLFYEFSLNFAISQFSQFFFIKEWINITRCTLINNLSCVKLQISYLRLTMKANFQSPYT